MQDPPSSARVFAQPVGVVAAQLCAYENHVDRPPTLRRAFAVDRRRLPALFSLLRAPGTGSGCPLDPVVMRLRRADGRVTPYALGGCGPSALNQGATVVSLRSGVSAFSWLGGDPDTRPPDHPLPDLIGRALATAATPQVPVEFGGAIDLAGAPFGTIVWQTPVAGSRANASNPGVTVFVATGGAPRCRAGQLRGVSVGAEHGQGNTFGGITIYDTAATPCALRGTIRVVGVDARGRRVTDVVRVAIREPTVLSPNVTRTDATREDRPGPALTEHVGVVGGSRDDPTEPDGQCRRFTAPDRWLVTVNGDQRIRSANLADADGRRFASCRRSLSSSGLQFGY